MTCPLCSSKANKFYDIYFRCLQCDGIFKDPSHLLNQSEEKTHYDNHQNNVEDIHYQNFVSPITNAVVKYQKKGCLGLDFGSGKAPVIAHVCKNNSYSMNFYDIYYYPDKKPLLCKYDFIAASEVVEHFNNPKKEFDLLNSLLKPKGRLFLMTLIYDDSIDFKSWSYKIDPTHVFFYTKKTVVWIAQNYGFKNYFVEKRLIILQKEQ